MKLTVRHPTRTQHPQGIGALVIGGDHPGLGVARSLGFRGISVYILEDEPSISQFSRYVTRVVRVGDLRDEQRMIEAVLEAGRRFGLQGWVLVPTRDEHVAALARHRRELTERFRVTTPDWETVMWAWDKRKSYDLAGRLGIPVPETRTVRCSDELAPFYDRLPLAVKPAIKERFFYATGAKAWRANTPKQLQRLFHEATSLIGADEVLIQEIIPGDGCQQFSFCAFCRDGCVHSSVVARRLRQHPHEFGRAATYVETTEMPVIEELAERFLKGINYYGLVEIEFKRDPRDGQFKLLDVNARIWGFHSLGLASGVDFPYLLFADQAGLPIERCRGVADVGWMRLLTDLPTALAEMVRGYLGVRSYVETVRRTRIESVFCRKDPLPSVGEMFLLPHLILKNIFKVTKSHARLF